MRRRAAGAGAGALLLLVALPCAPVVTNVGAAATAAFAVGPAPRARARGGGCGGGWCPARGGPAAPTFVLPRGGGDSGATVARARKLKDTDTAYLRQSAPHRSLPEEDERKRILIIGDVHGCYDELCDLLEEAKFERGRETLILAGDFVNKGPRSADVVKFAREVGAHAVLGNHELLSLRARATLDSSRRRGEAMSGSKYSWTKELCDEDLYYLRSLPYTIRLPMRQAVIVHAGLIPGAAIRDQDPLSLITTRNLVPTESSKASKRARSRWEGTTDQGRGVPWASKWTGPEHIYFGHNTKLGVQQRPFSTGLDTGCVYGGKLTAAILEPLSTQDNYGRVCQECGSPLVSPKCSKQYRCKVGQCTNKYPCRRSDPRCPRPGCTSKALAPSHELLSIPARNVYDLNSPWRKAKNRSQLVEETSDEQAWLLAREDVGAYV